VNPWDSKPQPETEASEQVPLSFPWPPLTGENTNVSKQVTQYIAQQVVPNMRKFLMDNDKVLASCINMVYYIVTPSLKGKARFAPLALRGIPTEPK
jgi:hypothetical protein